MSRFIKVAVLSDVPEDGRGLVVQAFGREIAIFKVGENFLAIDNRCLHAGASLGDGFVDGAVVTCPWHGWQYDLASGVCRNNPKVKLRTFAVRVEGDDLLIDG